MKTTKEKKAKKSGEGTASNKSPWEHDAEMDFIVDTLSVDHSTSNINIPETLVRINSLECSKYYCYIFL